MEETNSESREIFTLVPHTQSPLCWSLPAWLPESLISSWDGHLWFSPGFLSASIGPQDSPLALWLALYVPLHVSSLSVYVVYVYMHTHIHVCVGTLPHTSMSGAERLTMVSSPMATCFETGSVIEPGAHCLG